MNKIIIYGSQYGTTKEYAIELSKKMGVTAISYKEVKDVNSYDHIIYLGGLYAGGVCGMAKTLKNWNLSDNRTIAIITVGLAEPENEENKVAIKGAIKKQIATGIFEKSNIFHLRGGIDYNKLGKLHKVMMGMMYKKVKKLPPEKRNAETRDMIETYNKTVDFVDLKKIEPILQSIS